MFEYDFKLEIAKKVKICLIILLKSNYYAFKSSVLEMEKLDSMVSSGIITMEVHDKMCKDINDKDKRKIFKLLKLLDDYICYKKDVKIKLKKYGIFSNEKKEMYYNKIFNQALKKMVIITKDLA